MHIVELSRYCVLSMNLLLVVVQVYFEAEDVHACIVTCGGLCPGLNTVIREIVCGLHYMYGVKKVSGIIVSDCCSNPFPKLG